MGSSVKRLIKWRKRKENPEAKSDSYEEIVCNELSASPSASCPLLQLPPATQTANVLLLTWTIHSLWFLDFLRVASTPPGAGCPSQGCLLHGSQHPGVRPGARSNAASLPSEGS